jgi:hypothetical protein
MIDIIKKSKKHLGGPSQYSMNEMHKHHIVPRYRCKELDINPNFIENLVDVTRYQHAVIHWGYYCKNLTELKKHCNPPQWVLDMIPLGNGRDAGAAKLISLNEINQISLKGIKLTEEHKRKISIATKGKKWSEESLRKRSETNTGSKRSEETRRKMSEAQKGKIASEESKKKMSIAQTNRSWHCMLGKKHTEESKKKMSIAQTGKILSEETRRKISIFQTGRIVTEETRRKSSIAKLGKKRGPNKIRRKDFGSIRTNKSELNLILSLRAKGYTYKQIKGSLEVYTGRKWHESKLCWLVKRDELGPFNYKKKINKSNLLDEFF